MALQSKSLFVNKDLISAELFMTDKFPHVVLNKGKKK